MGRIKALAERFRRHVALPWRRDLAGAERAVFVVYDKADERRLRARKALFEPAATETGHRWIECDLTGTFAEWMAGTGYRESYFESPEDLGLKLEEDFRAHVADRVREKLAAPEADEDSMVAVFGIALAVRVRPRIGADAGGGGGRERACRGVLSGGVRRRQLSAARCAGRVELPRGPRHLAGRSRSVRVVRHRNRGENRPALRERMTIPASRGSPP